LRRVKMFRNAIYLVVSLVFCGWASFADAQEYLRNSLWQTVYSKPDGTKLRSLVRIESPTQGGGSGAYKTVDGNGQILIEGELMNVLVELRDRSRAIPSDIPLPPPGNDLGASVERSPYITGCWESQGTQGWFKWEVFDDNGKVGFIGEWGFLNEAGQQGPKRGVWNGLLKETTDPPVGRGSPKAVPFIQIK
jgi:hypothetical protein